MGNRSHYLKSFLLSQILWFVPSFVAMMSPVLLIVAVGFWWIATSHYWFWFFFLTAIVFGMVWFFLLFLRHFRLPRRGKVEHEKVAKEVAERFVTEFDYSGVTFVDWKKILVATLDLNKRIARQYGVRAKRPELDLPFSYVLLVVERISKDLEQYIEKNVQLFGIHPLDWIQLKHILFCIPSSKGKKNKKNKVEKTSSEEEKEAKAQFLKIPTAFYKKIFAHYFRLVGHYSMMIYSGKLRYGVDDLDGVEQISRQEVDNSFFRSRLVTLPWMFTLYCMILLLGFLTSGFLAAHEKVTRYVDQDSQHVTVESVEAGAQNTTFSKLQKHFPYLIATFCGLGLVCVWQRFRLKDLAMTVEPAPFWLEREKTAFEQVRHHVGTLSETDLQGGTTFCETFCQIVEKVDKFYSGKNTVRYKITLSELLKAQGVLINKLHRTLVEEIPGLDYFRVYDVVWGIWFFKLYTNLFEFYRKILWIDPTSAVVLELRRKIHGILLGFFSKKVGNSSVVYALELAGFYAVELYSGHLFYRREDTPLTVFVTGTPQSGVAEVADTLAEVRDVTGGSLAWECAECALKKREKSWKTLFLSPTSPFQNCLKHLKNADIMIIATKTDFGMEEREVVNEFVNEFTLECQKVEVAPLLIQMNTANLLAKTEIQNEINRNADQLHRRHEFRYLRNYATKFPR